MLHPIDAGPYYPGRRNRVREKSKLCQWCGTTMWRRRYGARLEDLGAFTRRRFCSRGCSNCSRGWPEGGRLFAAPAETP